MPPKAKYSKDQILDTAYGMVRKHGLEILTARGLSAELGTSTAPIFNSFQSIEEIQNLVTEKAKRHYKAYFDEGLKQPIPFKGVGLKYIEFAKDEPELFKLLFMGSDEGEEISHFLPAKDENSHTVLNTVEDNYGMNEEEAKKLYNHLSVYTHGLAVLFAQGRCVFTMEDASRMLSEVFFALKGGNNK